MAIMGPARMGIPIPHAASAPLLGVLVRCGRSLLTLALVGAAVRTGYYAVTSAFSIVVLVGLDAYLGSYAHLRESFDFFPAGDAAALWLTFASLVVWSLGAGLIQAWVIRRGLRRWTAEASLGELGQVRAERPVEARPRPHSGAFVGLAIGGFAAALASTGRARARPDRRRACDRLDVHRGGLAHPRSRAGARSPACVVDAGIRRRGRDRRWPPQRVERRGWRCSS